MSKLTLDQENSIKNAKTYEEATKAYEAIQKQAWKEYRAIQQQAYEAYAAIREQANKIYDAWTPKHENEN